MKTTIAILTIAALAAAAPKFRNELKHPIKELQAKPSPRITGGQEATPHSLPYQASIEIFTDEEGSTCGGSLISSNHILTAAHCLFWGSGEQASQVRVTLGAHRLTEIEPTQVSIVSDSIIVHEDYDFRELIYDIALIKLPASVIFTDVIRPVALPSREESEKSFVDDIARVSGWGLVDGLGTEGSDVLYYADVEVISNEECEQYYGDLLPSIICTSGEQSSGSCDGDSGGPLVDGEIQIGIVSFGIDSCLPGYPSGYTRITSFLDWIAQNLDV